MAYQDSPAMFAASDRLAAGSADAILLIARLLFGWMFLKQGWDHIMSPASLIGYVTSLGSPAPTLVAWLALLGELVIGIGMILGVATRYVALYTLLWMVIATWMAHRYWTYTGPAVGAQWAHFLKNLSIMGGAVALFVTGAGRFSVDSWMRRS